MNYLPPFEQIKAHLRLSTTRGGGVRVGANYEDVVQLVQVLLSGIEIDESWYLAQNADVAEGIRDGTIRSAKQHFMDHGYLEGRAPFQMPGDEAWYLAHNPDVAAQVQQRLCPSAQAHFNESGFREGRRPRA